jgi:urease alpha subunit
MTFVSQWAMQDAIAQKLGLKRLIGVAKDVRQVTQGRHGPQRLAADHRGRPADLPGARRRQLLTCEPAEVLPMAQRYFLF